MQLSLEIRRGELRVKESLRTLLLRNMRLADIHFLFIIFLLYCWLSHGLVFNNLLSRQFLRLTLVIFVLLTEHEKLVRADFGGLSVSRSRITHFANVFPRVLLFRRSLPAHIWGISLALTVLFAKDGRRRTISKDTSLLLLLIRFLNSSVVFSSSAKWIRILI